MQARIAEEQSRTEGSSGVLAHLDGLPGIVSPTNLLGEALTLLSTFGGLFCKMFRDVFRSLSTVCSGEQICASDSEGRPRS